MKYSDSTFTICELTRKCHVHFTFWAQVLVKFMFSKKATKIDEIFLTVFSNCQIDGEDFINFCGLLRKHELYNSCDVVLAV